MRLHVEYKSKKIEKICTNRHEAEKVHGREMAEKIHQRIDEIKAMPNVEIMVQYRVGRCHLLKGKRKDQYAVDLVQPYRLVFEKKKDQIEVVNIIEIVDYHK